MEKANFALLFGHLAVYIFVWIFAISAQAAATAWMANRYGDDTGKNYGHLTLSPLPHVDLIGTIIFPAVGFILGWFGGGIPFIAWGKPVPVDASNFRNPKIAGLMVSFAGTFATICIVLISFALLKSLLLAGIVDSESLLQIVTRSNSAENISWSAPIQLILWYSLFLNIALTIFSLIPFPPFSGGAIMRAFLPERFSFVLQFFEQYGLIIGILLIYFGFFSYIFNPILIFVVTLLGLG